MHGPTGSRVTRVSGGSLCHCFSLCVAPHTAVTPIYYSSFKVTCAFCVLSQKQKNKTNKKPIFYLIRQNGFKIKREKNLTEEKVCLKEYLEM